jgi:hypothetical protein
VLPKLFISASRSQRAGVENAEALPNPWGSGGSTTGGGQQRAAAGSGSTTAPGFGGGMFSNEMMTGVMRSLAQNPQLLGVSVLFLLKLFIHCFRVLPEAITRLPM